MLVKKVVQHIIKQCKRCYQSKVLIKGMTFKENVSDIRNSKVVDTVKEISHFHMNVDVEDPYAKHEEVMQEYGYGLGLRTNGKYDAVITGSLP